MAVSKELRAKLEKRKKEAKERSSGGKFLTIKEGTTRMRILSAGEDEDFAAEVIYFYLGDKVKGVISPASFGLPCAIMEAYEEMKSSDSDEDRAFAKQMRPKPRYFSMAIKYTDDKGKTIDEAVGAKLLILTQGQYTELIDWMLDEEYGDFTDTKTGYDIKFKRTGKGQLDTEYTMIKCKESITPKKYKGPYNLQDEVTKIIPTYEETKDLLNSFLGTDMDDEEEETPKKKKKVSSDLDDQPKKKKKKPTK